MREKNQKKHDDMRNEAVYSFFLLCANTKIKLDKRKENELLYFNLTK